jgi:hypothetical protein
MPSDEGMHGLSANSRLGASQLPAGGGNFDVNKGTATGPRGGQAAGISVTGPGGNTVGRAVGVGPGGGVAAVGGVRGEGGAGAIRGVGVGPAGGVVAGGAAVGRYGGAAAGFVRVSPAGRYTAAAAVRGGYRNWGIYGRDWYARYPGAWLATGWAAGAIWNTCTWDSAASYCGYAEEPMYYDYGGNVTYQDDGVYVDGTNVGDASQYYDQASTIATTGAKADAPADGDWLPLGVFALTKADETTSDVTIQLAINKQGVIRGNYTDTKTEKSQVVQGSADKKTQKVAFTVGDNTSNIIETGLYNLTKDEAPVLIHLGKDKTEQWLLVRLQQPDAATN